MKQIVLVTCLFLSALVAKAEHLPGGSITYECIGDNLYEVTLSIYRDCSGTPMVGQSLNFESDCGNSFIVGTTDFPLAVLDVTEVALLCDASASNSTCNGGTLNGYERYRYRTTVYLAPCADWTISWDICCRAEAFNVVGTPGLYFEAKLDNVVSPCGISSTFTDVNVPYTCVDQPFLYDVGAVGGSAASRAFHLIDARYFDGNQALSIDYEAPNTGAEPIAGMVIDTANGQISFTPTLTGSFIAVVQVDEYDVDGNWICSVMRDLQFVVFACSSNPPSPTSGTISGTTGACQQTGPRAVDACTSGDFCFTTIIDDPDASDIIQLVSNIEQVLPGATFTVTGVNPVSATICGNAQGLSSGLYPFTITAADNTCPIPGVQIFTYQFSVGSGAGLDGTAMACSSTMAFALIDSLLGTPAPGGVWTGPGGASNGIFDPMMDDDGDYTYTVTSPNGCVTSGTVTVTLLPDTDPFCISTAISMNSGQSFEVFPNPTAGEIVVSGSLVSTGKWQMALIDLQGRTVMTRALLNTLDRITVMFPENLRSGAYVLELQDDHSGAFDRRTILLNR
ncbi:MAG: T9SS type A sorting domain-containing protein [Flavobacteriales bacterium]|nr:T9SS type A sorting domain-containing protein [Flavobacteriales bacterium]